jgi:hypothetical protein
MTSPLTVTKLEAAKRQLEIGIRMIFSQADPVATHTLIGAASTLLSNLIERHRPTRSWDAIAQKANNLSPSNYFAIMRRAQNFLKHADTDPDETIALDVTDTDSLAFWAVMNLGEIDGPLGKSESVFQMWYLACYSPCLEDGTPVSRAVLEQFGDLRQLDRRERISIGARALNELERNDV